jgi:hypothetical protein
MLRFSRGKVGRLPATPCIRCALAHIVLPIYVHSDLPLDRRGLGLAYRYGEGSNRGLFSVKRRRARRDGGSRNGVLPRLYGPEPFLGACPSNMKFALEVQHIVLRIDGVRCILYASAKNSTTRAGS